MTVLEVLRRSTEFLTKRKIDNARLNAEHLLAYSLGKKRIEIYLEFERVLAEGELAPMRELIRRRGEGEPLQHLLGTVEFCGRVFKIDNRALVPRPETEELVELLNFKIQNPKSKIVDVGTGSGIIALTLAAKFPEAHVSAIDISEEGLTLARENAERLGLTSRINFMRGDLLATPDQFDVIVANLPYVSLQDRQTLAREVLHDPEVALFGGQHGDEIIRRLIEQAPPRLLPNGLLALEIGLGQSDSLAEFLQQKNFHDIETKQDYQGFPRFLLSRYG